MSTDGSPRAELLRRYVCGELDRTRVLAEAPGDEELARLLDEFDSASDLVDGAALAERQDLIDAEHVTFPAGSERLHAFGHQLQVRRRRDRGWIGLLIGLAAAVALIVFLTRGDDTKPMDPGPFLNSAVELVSPAEAVTADTWADVVFEIRFAKPRDATLVFIVYAGASATGAELARSGRVEETRWSPESTDTWPAEITWEVLDVSDSLAQRFLGSRTSRRSP